MGSENKSKELLRLLAVITATAVLVWFGNGLTPWWPLMWLAPFPALWYALHTSGRWAASAAAAGWMIGSLNLLVYFEALGAHFVGWLADFGGLALLFALGILLFRTLILRGKVWSGIMALPTLWVSVDWLRNWVTPHGTSADLAYTQLRFLPFLQLASITGPWGMSFVLLLVPSAAAAFLYVRRRDPRLANLIAWAVGGVLLGVLGFGAGRLLVTGQHDSIKVGLITSGTAENDNVAETGADATRLISAYAAQAKLLAGRGAEVIVMPEKIAAVGDPSSNSARGPASNSASYSSSYKGQTGDDAILQPVADAANITMIAGELHLSPTGGGVQRYNRANIYAPHVAVASYDKEHLLPPFESNITPGKGQFAISRGDGIWGVAICKDMDFTSMGRAYGRMDTGLMLVPAWDFNLDRIWHGHMAIMRGVEGGFSMARAAKDGYLTVSDDRGRVIAEARSDSAPFATLLTEVPVGHNWTLFQAWGDWFAWISVGLLGLVLVKAASLIVRR